ncbi:endochitinase A [Thrips palmi]|uniref:Endochitinase A n=1 Tax=Thrips palmi TaxID=161013 RepID=A0A6P8YJZ5_THRPL|nr:endochitinase A [Thrips palmi]
MTMDMHVQHRGGLRVEAASASTKTTTSSPVSSEASASSGRTGSPSRSPASSPSLPILHNNNNNNKSPPPPHQTSNKMSIKRSFDVAFLMAPDDLSTIKKRHQEQEQQLRLVTTASLMMRSAMTPLNVAITPPQPAEHQQHRILQQHPPSLMVMGHGLHDDQARSAFTKVSSSSSLGPLSGPLSGPGLLLMQNPPLPTSPSSVSSVSAGGLSPAYQNSLSPSPGPRPASSAASTPTPTSLGAVPGAGSPLLAAAVSASLMPPTFAALSLPAQNVCAKCNVSFRMTSDLVYHMRAHHKSDHAVNDPGRRRREQDKLKCPVCAESFRERHHLTRHMTAHQDKEGDASEEVEQQVDLGKFPNASKEHKIKAFKHR